MAFDNSTKTYNITTTQKKVNLAKLFGHEEVLVINDDEDNNIFYAQNPKASVVLTSNVNLDPSAVTGNVYAVADTSKVFIGDEIVITTEGSVEYDAKVKNVVTNTSVEIEPVTGLTPAATDTLTILCYKLPTGLKIKSDKYATNGFLLKHKDNTDTGLYQLTFVTLNSLKNLSPFFFKG